MIYVYLVTVRMKFEYSNNSMEKKEFSKPENLYAYQSIIQAKKDIWKMKQNERRAYSRWLRQDEETRGLFIHHVWDIEKIDVFNTAVWE